MMALEEGPVRGDKKESPRTGGQPTVWFSFPGSGWERTAQQALPAYFVVWSRPPLGRGRTRVRVNPQWGGASKTGCSQAEPGNKRGT